MFVYDSYKPASITRAVLSDLVNTFSYNASISVPGTNIGMITQPCITGGYTTIQEATDFTIGLKGMVSGLKRTGLFEVVKSLRLDIFSGLSARGDRQNIAILVLDEDTTDMHLLKAEVRLVKANNVKVIVVAVGSVPEQTIRFLASNPVDEHVIRVNDYDSFKENNINVLQVLCGFDKKITYDIDVKYFSNDQASGPKVTPTPTPGGQMTKTTIRVTKVNLHPHGHKSTTPRPTTAKQSEDMTTAVLPPATTGQYVEESTKLTKENKLLSKQLIGSKTSTESDEKQATSSIPKFEPVSDGQTDKPETSTTDVRPTNQAIGSTKTASMFSESLDEITESLPTEQSSMETSKGSSTYMTTYSSSLSTDIENEDEEETDEDYDDSMSTTSSISTDAGNDKEETDVNNEDDEYTTSFPIMTDTEDEDTDEESEYDDHFTSTTFSPFSTDVDDAEEDEKETDKSDDTIPTTYSTYTTTDSTTQGSTKLVDGATDDQTTVDDEDNHFDGSGDDGKDSETTSKTGSETESTFPPFQPVENFPTYKPVHPLPFIDAV